MNNYFHSFILSFNLNLESNERLLSRRRKTFDRNDPKGVAIQRFSLKRRVWLVSFSRAQYSVNVELVIFYEKGVMLWNV